jgi:hypothetical protein
MINTQLCDITSSLLISALGPRFSMIHFSLYVTKPLDARYKGCLGEDRYGPGITSPVVADTTVFPFIPRDAKRSFRES